MTAADDILVSSSSSSSSSDHGSAGLLSSGSSSGSSSSSSSSSSDRGNQSGTGCLSDGDSLVLNEGLATAFFGGNNADSLSPVRELTAVSPSDSVTWRDVENSDVDGEDGSDLYDLVYRKGSFLHVYDVTCYNPMDWSDRYDQTAEQARNISRLGQDIPVLQREVEPSVEYADDVLPLFSDTAAASYRLSCIRYGLLRSGGVSLNKTKLKMMPVRKAPKVRVSSAYMDAYEKKRSDL